MNKGPRVHVPARAAIGETIRIRTLIHHPMETGWRKDHHGKVVPRNRINKFVCKFAGKEIFRSDFFSGVSADPYLSFFTKVTESGTFEFTWRADGGKVFTRSAAIEVS